MLGEIKLQTETLKEQRLDDQVAVFVFMSSYKWTMKSQFCLSNPIVIHTIDGTNITRHSHSPYLFSIVGHRNKETSRTLGSEYGLQTRQELDDVSWL